MTVRAGIVVTGTEVLSGIVTDRNGPWLSERLREHGVQLAHIVVVGDRPADVRSALGFLAAEGVDLILTSGGLGPTADDLTAEVVGAFAGRPMVLDEALEERILAILRRNRARWSSYSEAAMRAGNRKQAIVPEGAAILEPIGTAPGLLVPPAEGAGPLVAVLPGPPGELRAMWDAAVATEPLRGLLARAGTLEQRVLRLYGVPESEIALSPAWRSSATASPSSGSRSRRACAGARSRSRPCSRRRQPRTTTRSLAGIRARHGDTLFSEDGATIDEQVAAVLADRTHRGRGILHGRADGRAADRPRGVQRVRAGRRRRVLERGEDRARGRAGGADRAPRRRLARGGGGARRRRDRALRRGAGHRDHRDRGSRAAAREEKPVGMVCISVAAADGTRQDRTVQLPGDRALVRERTTTVALHLLRRLLTSR